MWVLLLNSRSVSSRHSLLPVQGRIVTEGIQTDHPVINSALKTILNSILKDTKHAFDNQATGAKDWKSAVVKAFNPTVHAAASPDLVWGSAFERDIVTKLNLESGSNLRSSVAELSDSNIKVGSQVGKLSKEVFAEKINKSEEVIIVKNLGNIISNQWDFKHI